VSLQIIPQTAATGSAALIRWWNFSLHWIAAAPVELRDLAPHGASLGCVMIPFISWSSRPQFRVAVVAPVNAREPVYLRVVFSEAFFVVPGKF
jgi:hypothetical protein